MKRELTCLKRLAPSYERFIQPKAPELILSQLGLPQPDGAVLDAGGGTGRVAQYFCGARLAGLLLQTRPLRCCRRSSKKTDLRAVLIDRGNAFSGRVFLLHCHGRRAAPCG